MNTTTLRAINWAELDSAAGQMVGNAYAISESESNVLLESVTRQQGSTGCAYVLPLALKDSLLAAYDNKELDQWLYDHTEELEAAPKLDEYIVR